MVSDADIIRAVRKDAESGFRLIMAETQEPVYRHIRRLVIDHDDALDAMQETYLRVFRSFSSYKGESSLKVWIFRIATNEALRLIGKRRGNTVSLDDEEASEVRQLTAEEYVNFDDAVAVKFQNAILSLPTKQQLTFNMHYYDEMAYDEIARVIDSTPSSVKSSYHIAKEKIIKYMNK